MQPLTTTIVSIPSPLSDHNTNIQNTTIPNPPPAPYAKQNLHPTRRSETFDCESDHNSGNDLLLIDQNYLPLVGI
jgi:hypothetical protein